MTYAASPSLGTSVVRMLKDDHAKVKRLFEDYQAADTRRKHEIAPTIIRELEVHAELEERFIYPAIRTHIDADELMNEAIEEHHVVHLLLAELKKLKTSDEHVDAKFKVLGELVNAHIEEEEGEMLPKAEESSIDWEALSAHVLKRKEHLLAKGGGSAKHRRGKTRKKS